ncbi:MAG: hypothetical protein AB1476_04820 [Candidatus Hadarchaeota archaeon]
MRRKESAGVAISAGVGVFIVIIIAAAGVGGFLVLKGGGGGGSTATSGNVSTATSLSFNVDGTYQSQSLTSTVKMKNIGQSTAKLRMDMTVAGTTSSVIVDSGASKTWMWTAETGWQDMSSYISPETYTAMTQTYTTQLAGWTGTGEYTYTDPTTGSTVRIYNIQVNPSIPDSEFQPS